MKDMSNGIVEDITYRLHHDLLSYKGQLIIPMNFNIVSLSSANILIAYMRDILDYFVLINAYHKVY